MKLFVGAKGLVVHEGKVLLLRESSQYEEGTEVGKWDVPGGRIKPDETVREGLLREINEESGLSVTPGEVLGVFDGFPKIKGEVCHIVRVYFLCRAVSEEVTLSSDHDAYEWVVPTVPGDKQLMDDLEKLLMKVSEKHNE
jgi:8-oxo-dGTP diphosphatase